MLGVRGLSKSFGAKRVLDGVDLRQLSDADLRRAVVMVTRSVY